MLGPSYTFTDHAADLYISRSHKKKACKKLFSSIWEIFEALGQMNIDYGIVPIENTIHGTVRESFDALFRSDLHIVYKFALPIHHCLAVKQEATLCNIKKIISHHQAIGQCGKYLRKNFPEAQLIAFSSTVEAIQNCLSDSKNNKGVICSKKAAKKHSLKIIKDCIEDGTDNKTYFAVLKNKDKQIRKSKGSGNLQTSIAFYFHKDKPGTLFGVFKDFADLKVNMTKIESRPAGEKMGDYIFFLDFEGSLKDEKIKNLLKRISTKVAELKNFGTYEVDANR